MEDAQPALRQAPLCIRDAYGELVEADSQGLVQEGIGDDANAKAGKYGCSAENLLASKAAAVEASGCTVDRIQLHHCFL